MTDTTEIADRVSLSKELLGHPMDASEPPVAEGTHYEVLAYTDWADAFIPTVVAWQYGDEPVDRFKSRTASLEHRHRARQAQEA